MNPRTAQATPFDASRSVTAFACFSAISGRPKSTILRTYATSIAGSFGDAATASAYAATAEEGSGAFAMASAPVDFGAAAGALGAAPPESGASWAQIDPVRRTRLAAASPVERNILVRIVHLRPAGLESSVPAVPPSRGHPRLGRSGAARQAPGWTLDPRVLLRRSCSARLRRDTRPGVRANLHTERRDKVRS